MAAFQAREQRVEHHIPGSSEQGVEKWGADLEGQKEGFQQHRKWLLFWKGLASMHRGP